MTLLNARQKFALLQLYSVEIKKCLAPLYYSPEIGGSLTELLDVNKLEDLFLGSCNEDEFCKELWEALIVSPMNIVLYEAVLNYLSKVDADLHSILCLTSENDTRSQFSKVLSNIDQFWKHINVDATMAFFKKIPCYDNIVTTLERSWKGDEDEDTKKRVLLRTIPLFGSNAIYDLMRSIYDNSEEAALFVNELHPSFLRYYDLVDKERSSPRGVITFCPVGAPVKKVIEEETHPNGMHKFNLNYRDLPPALLSKDNVAGRLLKSVRDRVYAETAAAIFAAASRIPKGALRISCEG